MSGYLHELGGQEGRKSVTVTTLQAHRDRGEKITSLTCYDASFAVMMDRAGVEVLLIGDSVGMTCQGHDSTLPVTLADMTYHTACVARGNQTAFIVSDMPFGTYATPSSAFENAVKLMQAGAQMVKIEGSAWLFDIVRFLTERAIPVCPHLGLTPQSVHQLGGFKVQGKTFEAAERLKEDALTLQEAGASLIVLEGIPANLGAEITGLLRIPTIGIGAGPSCSGQVLVMHDMLGIYPGKTPRFAKNFMEDQLSIEAALKAYVKAVKDGSFPAPEHCF